ncbi:MAG: DUF4292 domain-containing protein [Flavobacteriia bacterium]|nr:DUF4292 domain-containing protein [Flavobacteriia bacterium]
MSRYINCMLLLISGLFIVSCASNKEVVENYEKLERKKTQVLVESIDSISKLSPRFFYTKIKTNYSDTNRTNSFKTSIRLAKDSAVGAIISFANIPIINSIITKDSLTLTNKKDRCFIKHDLGYFKDAFGVDFNYKNIEEIILGLPVDYDTNQRYFQIHDHSMYIVSSHRKNKMRRTERRAKEDIIVKYFLNKNISELTGMEIESPSDSTTIKVEYIKREYNEGFNFPKEVLINILTPRNKIQVELTYDKIEVNLPQPIEMVIPESYEKCE